MIRRLLPWAALAAATAACALGLQAVGLESPALFAALLVGLAASLLRAGSPSRTPRSPPRMTAGTLLGPMISPAR